MRSAVLLVFLSSLVGSQSTALLRPPGPINLIPPALNGDGSVAAFAAATSPDGTPRKGTDLYLFDGNLRRLTNYAGEFNWTGVMSVTLAGGLVGYTAQPAGSDAAEEVRVIDIAGNNDRKLVTDKGGCVQILCVNCFKSCLGPVHLTADGTKALYSVHRNQPFHVVNTDGSGDRELPIYSGSLAPSAQRVISRAGQLVFTSAAPAGPTFAAAATDVQIVNLDGTGLKQVTHFGKASFYAYNASISADGSLIAFESNFAEGDPLPANQVWVVKPDGTGLKRISSGSEPATSPSISADASVVVFVQGKQIKRARTSGDPAILTLTRLSTSEARDTVVNDDGSQVVFTLGPAGGTAAAVYRIPTDRATDLRDFSRIYAPRFVSAEGVASAAGFGLPSPGSLISVYGANLGTDELAQAGSFPLPETLNGVSLAVNGRNVPLVAVTPWQINAQLPQSVSVGAGEFGVSALEPVRREIAPAAPAILAYPVAIGKVGYQQAAAFHAGTGVAADADHPASPGEVLEIYGMGLGLTDPPVTAGVASPGSPPARAVQMPRVRIDDRDANVLFAGLVPGLAGVYQVNAVVPDSLPAGLHTLEWRDSRGITLNYATIAVK